MKAILKKSLIIFLSVLMTLTQAVLCGSYAFAEDVAEEPEYEAHVLTSDGDDYEITVNCGADAKIPEGAALKVSEIPKGTEEYERYKAKAESYAAHDNEKVSFARFFDIAILADGQEIEPEAPVQVRIRYDEPKKTDESQSVNAMHFGDKGAELLEAEYQSSKRSASGEVSFDAEGFSVYGIFYTVDFFYNGFSYSIPGKSSVSLEEIFLKLGIKENASDAAEVTFSDSTLIKVEHGEDGWILTSFAPFKTEETLTVKMADGTTYEISVTDNVTSSMEVTFNGSSIDGTVSSIQPKDTYQLEMLVNPTSTVGPKTVTVTVPTGWTIVGYSMLDSETPVSNISRIRLGEGYEQYVTSTELAPVPGSATEEGAEAFCGYIKTSDGSWGGQYLVGYEDYAAQYKRTYGGVVTFNLDPETSNVRLRINLKPQATIFIRNSNVEPLPDVTISLDAPDGNVVKTLKANATGIARPNISLNDAGTSATRKLFAQGDEPGKSEKIIAGAQGSCSNVTSGDNTYALIRNYYAVMQYPEGVFYSKAHVLSSGGGAIYNAYRWNKTLFAQKDLSVYGTPEADALESQMTGSGNYIVYEDPVNGGGYIVMAGTKGMIIHGGGAPYNQFGYEFYAKTGPEWHPDAAKTWDTTERIQIKSLSGDDFNWTLLDGTVKEKADSQTTYISLISNGGEEVYDITLYGPTTVARRNMEADFDGYTVNGNEYYFQLFKLAKGNSSIKSALPYTGVKFYLENVDDSLGLRGLNLPGKEIRNVTLETTKGKVITLEDPELPNGSKYTSPTCDIAYMAEKAGIQIDSDEYIRQINYTADLIRDTYSNLYISGGLNGYGRKLDQEGQVRFAVLDSKGNVAKDINGKDLVTTITTATGDNNIGVGSVSVSISKSAPKTTSTYWRASAGSTTFYPDDTMHFVSTYTPGIAYRGTQESIVDPVITIALPVGISLKPDTVMGQSIAGNHGKGSSGAEAFPLKQIGEARTITDSNGLVWNCFDYTSAAPLDMVAVEKENSYSGANNTLPDHMKANYQQISVKFEAVVDSNCTGIKTEASQVVLWDLGWSETRTLESATTSTNYVHTDTNQKLSGNRGPNALYASSAATGDVHFTVVPLPGLRVIKTIRSVADDGKYNALSYNGTDDSIAVVQQGKNMEVDLTYLSTAESEMCMDTTLYFAVPKSGAQYKYLNNISNAPKASETLEPFEFNAELTGPVTMESEADSETIWTTYYAVSAGSNNVLYEHMETTEDKAAWEPVNVTQWMTAEQLTESGHTFADVVMVKFVAENGIEPGKAGRTTIPMKVDDAAQVGALDLWRTYYKAAMGGNERQWDYSGMVAAKPSSASLEGLLFVDADQDQSFDSSGGGADFRYIDGGYTAVLMKTGMSNINVTIQDDGSMVCEHPSSSLTDSDVNLTHYLLPGTYTLEVTRNQEAFFTPQKTSSAQESNGEDWFNNAKGNAAKAAYTFTITDDGQLVGGTFIPKVYYAGVGLRGYQLSLEKTVTEISDAADEIKEKAFGFSVNVDGSEEGYTGQSAPEAPQDSIGTDNALIALRNGESCRTYWLPYGQTYSVTEDSYSDFKTTIAVNESSAAETRSVSGTITDDVDVKVTNEYQGSANYTVEFYEMKEDGTYPDEPNHSVVRSGRTGQTVSATETDKDPAALAAMDPALLSSPLFHYDAAEERAVESGTISETTPLVLKLYFRRYAKVQLLKRAEKIPNSTQEQQPLSGAQFALYRIESGARKNLNLSQYGTDRYFTTDANGMVVLTPYENSARNAATPSLADGEYVLVEKVAPVDFKLATEEIHFTVSGSGVTVTSPGESAWSDKGLVQAVETTGTTTTIKLVNQYEALSPGTGVSGALPFAITVLFGGIAIALIHIFKSTRKH